DGFGVPGGIGADDFVRRIRQRSPGIPDACGKDARQRAVELFDAPEASRGERCGLGPCFFLSHKPILPHSNASGKNNPWRRVTHSTFLYFFPPLCMAKKEKGRSGE